MSSKLKDRWGGFIRSEIAFSKKTAQEIRELRDSLIGRPFVAIDGGVTGAALVFDAWKRWPTRPYFVSPRLTEKNALWELGQAMEDVDCDVVILESGYLNVRQPQSLTTARAAGFAAGAAIAYSGIVPHLVHVPASTWQGWSLDLSGNAARKDRKAAAIALGAEWLDTSSMNAEQKSAVSDANGIATWWTTSPIVRHDI